VFTFLHSAGYYGREQGYANPRMDALIETAESEPDEKKRGALYAHPGPRDEDLPSVTIADARRSAPSAPGSRLRLQAHFPDMPYGGDYYDLSKSEARPPCISRASPLNCASSD